MLNLYTQTKEYYNDICEEIRLFAPYDRIILSETQQLKGDFLLHFFSNIDTTFTSQIKYFIGDDCVCEYTLEEQLKIGADALENKRQIKRLIKNSVYYAFKNYTGKTLPWGSLTGIRPVKLARDLTQKLGTDKAKDYFKSHYDVSKSKTALAFEILNNQQSKVDSIKPNSLDVYIGIPFCLSRCKYCSFISKDNANHLKSEYISALIGEIKTFDAKSYDVRSIYIGGGTPTTLEPLELQQLLAEVNNHFNTNCEFTVEAGRADTITKEKLGLLKEYNVNRISINSQTTKDETLELIGRSHTAKDFFNAFELAKGYNFNSINTDIILGLPKESVEDVQKTLEDILKFEPTNITVHTLALKRASEFVTSNSKDLVSEAIIAEMIDYSFNFLHAHYAPYYLYRQKYMSGNLENVGFAKKGFECVYNIDIMEELTSNCAFGAGGISKVLINKENRIERQANPKDIATYINNIAELVRKKERLFERE